MIRDTLLRVLARITPKINQVVLRGFPAYDDNVVAIYQALRDCQYTKIIWVVDDVSVQPPIDLDSQTRLVKRGSWSDYFSSLVSKYIFITHGHFVKHIPAHQVCVNLWHGIPYKTIGRFANEGGRKDTFTVATSQLTRTIFAAAFGADISAVHITGQARTDRLLGMNDDERSHLKSHICGSKRLLLWLPTYRASAHRPGRDDGRVQPNPFNCSDFDLAAFNAILESNNAHCLLKLHPMAQVDDLTVQGNQASSVQIIDDAWLEDRRISLYQLAAASDALISDISSIIVDYLLVDRPIILLFEDIDEYANNRGFILSPIERWLPAGVSRCYAEFESEVTAVCQGKDDNRFRRHVLREHFFDFTDDQASKRIIDLAFGRVAEDVES
jgi:CDP-glycerol glycerophosphotransferase (TagB/SpsB family)